MPQPLRLENFDLVHAAPPPEAVPAEEVESVRLAAFDTGYSAGWEDATKAAAGDQARIGAELERTLQDLGFTYHEARAHVMRGLAPLLQALCRDLLPGMLRDTLGHRLAEEIRTMSEGAADAPLVLAVSPADAEALRRAADTAVALPLEIVEEPDLPEGQLYFRLGSAEREIDLSGTLRILSDALEAIDTLNTEDLSHG